MPIFTVGHGVRSLDELVALLREADVRLLIDVRSVPRSRRHPQMNRERLQDDLPARDVAYEWRGDALGGFRKASHDSPNVAWREPAFRGYADYMATSAFHEAVTRLIEDARSGLNPAVMCAETLWWRCHRRLIADALMARGIQVVHLMGPGKRQVHELSDSARVEAGGLIVYDRIDAQEVLPLD